MRDGNLVIVGVLIGKSRALRRCKQSSRLASTLTRLLPHAAYAKTYTSWLHPVSSLAASAHLSTKSRDVTNNTTGLEAIWSPARTLPPPLLVPLRSPVNSLDPNYHHSRSSRFESQTERMRTLVSVSCHRCWVCCAPRKQEQERVQVTVAGERWR